MRTMQGLNPVMEYLAGYRHGFSFGSEMVVRFVNKTSMPAVRYIHDGPTTDPRNIIPFTMLERFTHIKLEIPISLIKFNGQVIGGIINTKFWTDGRGLVWWAELGQSWWEPVSPGADSEEARSLARENMLMLEHYLLQNTLSGSNHQVSLQQMRLAVGSFINLMNARTDPILYLRHGWMFERLDAGIHRHDRSNARRELLKEVFSGYPQASVFE